MSVYVDDMQSCMPNKNWRYIAVCHMMADTIKELHDFATLLGLKRAWFQNNNKRFPHYDLTSNKRKIAVKHGAIEKSPIELIVYFKGKLNVKEKKN